MIDLLQIAGAACATNIWLCAEPTMAIRTWLDLHSSGRSWVRYFGRLIDCGLCTGFWVGVLVSFGQPPLDLVMSACAVSVAAELLHRRLSDLRL